MESGANEPSMTQHRKPSIFSPPFPEKLLFDGEVVSVDLKPHWWHFAQPAAASVVTVILWLLSLSKVHGGFGTVLHWVTGIGFLYSALWLGIRWLQWRSTHFVVTSDRLIYRSGIFAKQGIAIPLERVNNINFQQTIFEKLIRAGDLLIESGGEDGQQRFSDVRKPDEVQRLIHAQIEENGKQVGGSVVHTTDVATQLEKLEGLRDRGSISHEEFEREKRRLLG
jgi:uncharacterized membrane protein YdbT with pleckstrin-like domain